MILTVSDIAKMIDHSLLRPNLTEAEFLEGVKLSKNYQSCHLQCCALRCCTSSKTP